MYMKIKVLILLLASLLLSATGYIFTNSIQFNLCGQNQYSCRDLYNNIGDPLLLGMLAIAIIFLTLLFLPKAWTAWRKFAIWYVPLATLLFIFYPEPGSGDLLSPYPETVLKWVSGIYVAISLVIIAKATLKNKKES